MKALKTILAGFCFLFSCISEGPYPEAMRQAMRCMEQHPDSALTYLASLDSAIRFEPEETRMYHGLLTTKAQYKEYIPLTSDSLMLEVVRFYQSYGDADKLMEAYYYLSTVYQDLKDTPRALHFCQLAAEVGKQSQQYVTLGRIYQDIGTLLAYQSLYEDALIAYQTSYIYFSNLKDDDGIVYALRNQGRMYDSLERLDSAEYYYQAAYLKAFAINNREVINAISSELGSFYADQGKLDSAKSVYSKNPVLKDDAIYLHTLARIYLQTSQTDSAQFYFLQALQKGKENQNIYLKNVCYKHLGQLEVQKGNLRSAFDYARKSIELTDSIKKITRTEAIGKAHALYNYQQIEKENQQLALRNKQTQIYIYLLIITLLVLGGIVTFYFNYTRKQKRLVQEQRARLLQQQKEFDRYSAAHKQENERKIQEIKKQLQQTNEETKQQSHSQIQELEIQLSQSEKRQLEAQQKILELSNQLIEAKKYEQLIQKDAFENSTIYQRFHEAAEECSQTKINEKDWSLLIEEIDTTYDGFTNRLKELFPPISQHELHLCYLVKTHISPKGMAKILCLSASAISNGRSRLYKKIYKEEGNCESLDRLILDL